MDCLVIILLRFPCERHWDGPASLLLSPSPPSIVSKTTTFLSRGIFSVSLLNDVSPCRLVLSWTPLFGLRNSLNGPAGTALSPAHGQLLLSIPTRDY
ncbi:hypothetical protein ACE6H2_014402 [Prunus campanulata]